MFNSEKEMVTKFNNSYNTFLDDVFDFDKKSFILNEHNTNNGIVDIVMGTFNTENSNDFRKSINVNLLSPLLYFEDKKEFSLEYFMDFFNISKSLAKKCLNEYSEAGYFIKISKDKYIKSKIYKPNIDNIISIEAKLRDWNKAIKQAYRYKRFSNYVFVLLDEKYSQPALKSIDLFKEFNIGLITMNDKNFHVHYLPKKNKPKDLINMIRLNEKILNCSPIYSMN